MSHQAGERAIYATLAAVIGRTHKDTARTTRGVPYIDI